jgi:hypothetical protein
MNRNIEISIKENCYGYYRLREEYQEYIKLRLVGGGELFCEFAIKLTPNSNVRFLIEIEGKNDYEIDTVEKGIKNGVNKLNDLYNYYGIGFSGMNFLIKIGRFHIIDSKPIGYELNLIKVINYLIEQNHFQRNIIRYSNSNKLFDIQQISDKINPRQQESDLSIKLPILNQATLRLTSNWRIISIIGDVEEDDKKVKLLTIVSDNYNEYRSNEFRIKFEDKIPLWVKNRLINESNEFVREIYKMDYNLGGLHIDIKSIGEWDRKIYRLKYVDSFIWALESIFFKKDNTSLEENSFFSAAR